MQNHISSLWILKYRFQSSFQNRFANFLNCESEHVLELGKVLEFELNQVKGVTFILIN